MLLSVPGSWPFSISSLSFQRHPLICATENKPDQIKTFFVVRKAQEEWQSAFNFKGLGQDHFDLEIAF